MEFGKNKIFRKILSDYLITYSMLLDTPDYVPEKYLRKVYKRIYKDMKKKFKERDIYYLLDLKNKGVKLTFFEKLKVWFSHCERIYNLKKSKKENIKKKKVLNHRQRVVEKCVKS